MATLTERVIRRVAGSSDWYFRHQIRRRGGHLPAVPPRVAWMNTALKSHGEVSAAVQEVRRCGLVPHADTPKNWDALAAVGMILGRTAPSAAILEVGAELYSVALPWLCQYGYRDLTGIDLVHTRRMRYGPIMYEPGDLTRTRFADGRFDAVASLSVIEHGVDPGAYFAEMARVLRRGGLLVTSTDYWCDPIDTLGKTAYGVPIRIFTEADVRAMLVTAAEAGLRLAGPALDLRCGERVVTWQGLSYTFACFALERM